MPTPPALVTARGLFSGYRQGLLEAMQLANEAKVALENGKRTLTDPAAIASLQHTADQAASTLATARTNEKTARQNVTTALSSYIAGLTTFDAELAKLDPTAATTLFPVRIETRFGVQGTTPVLRVRIYPDEIFVNTHEIALTQEEKEAGEAYWDSEGDGFSFDGWRVLTSKMSAERASYVRAVTRPVEGPAEPILKASDFTRPGEAVLPDRWWVRVALGATVQDFKGNVIPEPLTMTADPTEKPAAELFTLAGSNPPIAVDDELAWTVDYGRAEAVGMAVTIPLTNQLAPAVTAGFDRVLVFGVKSSFSPTEAANHLGDLMDAHRYTRGMAVVRQGTPTNNTEDAPSPLPLDDPDGTHSAQAEQGGIPPASSDGFVLGQLLGSGPASFGQVDGAFGKESTRGAEMAKLLWPTTFGYVVDQLMSQVFSPAHHKQIRDYFLKNVRARGPAPAFRIGQVPYGVLPALSIGEWGPRGSAPDQNMESAALNVMKTLRATWKTAAETGVPVLAANSSDPVKDLLRALAVHPSSREVRVRHAQGQLLTYNLLTLLGNDFRAGLAEGKAIVDDLLHRVAQSNWSPTTLAGMIFGERPNLVAIPLVAQASKLSETTALPQVFFDTLKAASSEQLLTETYAQPIDQGSVFYKLARQALLSARVRAALIFVGANPAPPGIKFFPTEMEIVLGSLGEDIPFSGLLRSNVYGSIPLGDRSEVVGDQQIVDAKNALDLLQPLPSAEIDRLFSETIDLASHRLDAWLTAYATRRVVEMRTTNQATIPTCFGGYAFVENVRPVSRTTTSLTGYGTVEIQPGNGGFVQAPSLTHATAAALLRNAHLSCRDDDPNKYAFDLSSARARGAREVLEELRAGQPLGAVLGYKFERAVQANPTIAQYRFALRNYFPLVPNKPNDPAANVPADTVPAVAARNVVDGLALWRAAQANPTGFIPATATDLPHSPTAAFNTLLNEINRLGDFIDAVSDLNVAEGVLQLVRGNATNAAGNLDALARGTRPPDPQMGLSQRGGVPASHRVALVFPRPAGAPNDQTVPTLPAPAGWPAATTARALAEPLLDAWVGGLLGNPTDAVARVALEPVAPTDTASTLDVPLAQLGLRPLDLVAIARAPASPNAGSILDRRIAAFATAAIASDTHHRVGLVTYQPSPGPGRLSIPQIMEVARAVGAMLGGARALLSDDLTASSDSSDARKNTKQPNLDLLPELAGRVALPLQTIQDLAGVFLPGVDLVQWLTQASAYVPDAFPAPGATPAALALTADAVQAELLRRVQAANDAVTPLAAAPGDQALQRVAQLRAIFGGDFLALPRVVPANAVELNKSLGARGALLPDAVALDAPVKCVQQAAQVYEGLGRFRTVSLYAGTLGRPPLRLDVAQLPFVDNERWIGAKIDQAHPPQPNRQSLLLFSPFAAAPATNVPWQGVVLQDWVEVIPNLKEETGLAFHYDNPGAEAAQTILVMAPSMSPTSTFPGYAPKDVWATLNETLDLAKIRGVDLELVGGMGQFLPAIFAPQNMDGATAGTNWFGQFLNAV